ncbi:hypothetical protein AX15_004078 [Amanita polypyramis BW_CC]|nr:hypothetical protein AX15_004078 [Amanita polypyramis BW_CC]
MSTHTLLRKALERVNGDFNLHSALWDSSCAVYQGIAGISLLTTFQDNNFQLLNDDEEPTWFREGDIPRVLDLVFLNNALPRQDAAERLELVGEKFDHRTLQLNLALGRRTTSGKPYIKANSEEELAFYQDIISDLPHWHKALSAQDKTSSLMSSITNAFEKYSKTPNPKSKPTSWWTDECNEIKDTYSQSPTKTNRKAYYRAIRDAKKVYFGNKIDEMCENNKPWEGIRWTRDRPLSSIPRFIGNNKSINTTDELWPILDKQFNS